MRFLQVPVQFELLHEIVSRRANGTLLSERERVLHPVAAKQLFDAQYELMEASGSDEPIMVFSSITRSPEYQARLLVKNRMVSTSQFPNGIPTAEPGASLHQWGLAFDLSTQETMRRINKHGIDMSFQELRQFLASKFIMGIASEAWHFDTRLSSEYSSLAGWRLRDALFSSGWSGLSDEEKEELLRLSGGAGKTLREVTVAFQTINSHSLTVDGVPGPKTLRLAFCRFATENAYNELGI